MATRYDDIFGEVENLIVCWVAAGPGVSDTTLPFEIAVSAGLTTRVTANAALKARAVEVDDERQIVMAGHDRLGQPLRRGRGWDEREDGHEDGVTDRAHTHAASLAAGPPSHRRVLRRGRPLTRQSDRE